MLQSVLVALALASSAIAAPLLPQVQLGDSSTITGGSLIGVDFFKGIPFAQPPVGDLRFRPPVKSTASLDGKTFLQYGSFCLIQAPFTFPSTNLPQDVINIINDLPQFKPIPGLDADEDCLSLNVFRPANTKPGAKLPVLFWIFGGGFQLGSGSMYDGSPYVLQSVNIGMPVIVVTINYRLGAYGWLGGSEVVKQGPGNWGLLDQRLALEWVADNIAGFGGDPSKVTIFGESAGAISAGHQMLLYDGDNTYKGKPLFRGAIMQSGSVVPTEKLDSAYPQHIFDHVAEVAGCSNAPSPLECLRALPVEQMNKAQSSVPGIFSYQSIGLSFLPRWDGHILSDQVHQMVKDGKYARVPFIIGDQEDEGTLFALTLSNVTTTQDAIDWVENLLRDTPRAMLEQVASSLYPSDVTQGSPFNTWIFNELYPGFKRNAALLGDFVFQWPRRFMLDNIQDVDRYSFLSKELNGTPFLGTFHGNDILFQWFNPINLLPTKAYRNYFIAFANNLNPNTGSQISQTWPRYVANKGQNLVISMVSLSTAADNFRKSASDYVNNNIQKLLF